jgi:hypothetical protein
MPPPVLHVLQSSVPLSLMPVLQFSEPPSHCLFSSSTCHYSHSFCLPPCTARSLSSSCYLPTACPLGLPVAILTAYSPFLPAAIRAACPKGCEAPLLMSVSQFSRPPSHCLFSSSTSHLPNVCPPVLLVTMLLPVLHSYLRPPCCLSYSGYLSSSDRLSSFAACGHSYCLFSRTVYRLLPFPPVLPVLTACQRKSCQKTFYRYLNEFLKKYSFVSYCPSDFPASYLGTGNRPGTGPVQFPMFLQLPFTFGNNLRRRQFASSS